MTRSLHALLLPSAVAVVLVSLITKGHFAATGDAPHYMIIAQSILLDQDIDLANDYSDRGRIINGDPGDHAKVGRYGHLRPVHDTGFPILSLPIFAVAYGLAEGSMYLPPAVIEAAKIDRFIALRQVLSLYVIGLTVLLMMILHRSVYTLAAGVGSAAAATCAALFALSPPVMSMGYVFMTEVPSAILVLVSFRFLTEPRREEATRQAVFLVGAAVGTLVFVHVRNVGIAITLGAALLWRLRRHRWLAVSFLGGFFILLSCRLSANYLFWGTAVTGPHVRTGEWLGLNAFTSEMLARSAGMLFDPRHGLLVTSPIYILVPAGLILWHRRAPGAAALAALISGVYLLLLVCPITNDHGWRGGWSPPARFWVPISPLLFLGVPLVFSHRRGRMLASALAAWQVAIDFKGWTEPMLLWSEGPGPSPLLTSLVGRLGERLFVPFEGLDRVTWTRASIGLGAILVVTWLCVSRERRVPEP